MCPVPVRCSDVHNTNASTSDNAHKISSADGKVWCRSQFTNHCFIWFDTQALWSTWTENNQPLTCAEHQCKHKRVSLAVSQSRSWSPKSVIVMKIVDIQRSVQLTSDLWVAFPDSSPPRVFVGFIASQAAAQHPTAPAVGLSCGNVNSLKFSAELQRTHSQIFS